MVFMPSGAFEKKIESKLKPKYQSDVMSLRCREIQWWLRELINCGTPFDCVPII